MWPNTAAREGDIFADFRSKILHEEIEIQLIS